MKRIDFVLQYLKYYFSSGNRHHVHSPFIYKFYTKVINGSKRNNMFPLIEERRKINKSLPLLIDKSEKQEKKTKRLGKLIASSSKSPKYCRLLFRITDFFQPQHMLEIGCAAGISALYQAAGSKNGRLVTLEGNEQLVTVAMENINALQVTNINVVAGNFNDTLQGVLNSFPVIDYIFMDGNHKKAATLLYFEMCLEKSQKNTIFVIDDINWSFEMKEAWSAIKNHAKVTATIDLFVMGIVFINPELSKENFKLRF
jgi:predicted O-methyltransferase YrrM